MEALTIKGHWYLKSRNPDSVLATANNREDVQRQADTMNENYQTDNYYVEAFDPDKVWLPPKR